MDNVKTTQTKIFDFQAAIRQGFAMDESGRHHEVVAHEKFLVVTRCEGVEYRFNEWGEQVNAFPRIRLAQPFLIRRKLYRYAVYQPETMELVSMHESPAEPLRAESEDGLKYIITTLLSSKRILKDLGLDGYPKIESAPGQ